MNTPLTDGELLDLLADALDPAPIRPTPAEYEQLRKALATVPPPEAERRQTPRKVTSLRRLPHPVAAVVMVATLTTGGAAAAVGTNTLPDPLRSIAFAVGLPVTSPADERIDNDLAALRATLNLGDAMAIRADAAALSRDLDALSPDDRVTVDGGANLLLAQAAVWLNAHPSVSDPIGSGGRHQGNTDGRVDGGDGRAVTKRGSEGGPTGRRGDDGSGTQEPPSNRANTSNAQSGGNDSSTGTPGSRSGPGSTGGDGRQGGDGNSPSGTTPATGQKPGTDDGGGGSRGSGPGGSDSSGSAGGSSSSDGGASSTSGGPGSPPAGSGSTGPATPAATSGGGGSGGGSGGGDDGGSGSGG